MRPTSEANHADITPGVHWIRRLGGRMRFLWPAKMAGTILFMAAFFVVYFRLLRQPLFPVTVVPRLGLDRLIGFHPDVLPLYFSLWIYVSLPPAFLDNRRELLRYLLSATILSLAGFAIFLVWPTEVPTADIDWSHYPAFAFLKNVDASGNACPSMHAAFAVFTAIWFERPLRGVGAGPMARALNWLWCLGILYSTVATRQHVVVDMLAGAALGFVVGRASASNIRLPTSSERA
jgi:membrane-associated phospholipid phosphatase